jgi:hypothetical protein
MMLLAVVTDILGCMWQEEGGVVGGAHLTYGAASMYSPWDAIATYAGPTCEVAIGTTIVFAAWHALSLTMLCQLHVIICGA